MFTDFEGNLIKVLVSKNSWEFLRNFTPRNSWEFTLNALHQVYGFLGELNKKNFLELVTRNSLDRVIRISSEWVTRNSSDLAPRNELREIPRNSCQHFHRNFLWAISRNFRGFSSKLLLGGPYRFLSKVKINIVNVTMFLNPLFKGK